MATIKNFMSLNGSSRRPSSPTHHKRTRKKIKGQHERRLAMAVKAMFYRGLEQGDGGSDIERLGEPQVYYTPVIKKSVEQFEMIRDSLRSNILFNSYSENQIKAVILAMKPQTVEEDFTLIEQGSQGYNFFVVDSGKFEYRKVTPEGIEETEGVACRGDCFGELSLLFDSPRSLSVTSVEPSKVWRLSRPEFQGILASDTREKYTNIIAVLKTSPLLKNQDDNNLVEKIARAGVLQRFSKNDLVIEKGDVSNLFYFVISGDVEVQNSGFEGAELIPTVFGQGEYFGEAALLEGTIRTADVVAQTNCELLVLDGQSTTDLLGGTPMLSKLNERFEARLIRSVPEVSVLNDRAFEEFRSSLELRIYKKKRVIVEQGAPGEHFYIIKKGNVKVVRKEGNNMEDLYLGRGSWFGHVSIMQDMKTNAEVVADSDEVHVLRWTKDVFQKFFGDWSMSDSSFERLASESPRPIRPKNAVANSRVTDVTKRKRFTSRLSSADPLAERLTSIHYSLKDFVHKDQLGSGAFGVVTLVSLKDTGAAYALKAVSIKGLRDRRMESTVVHEKCMLKSCDHPFILKLHQTFKDKRNVYFLLELVQGGDLYTYIFFNRNCDECEAKYREQLNDRHGAEGIDQPQDFSRGNCNCSAKLPENEARFFAACVASALTYLHKQDIAYRDLKLENLMLDAQGYVKVVDFGFAKRLGTKRAHSTCGTMDYMAPELLLRSGHNRSVDLWAMGVLFYELLVGYSPFAKTRDPERRDTNRTFRNIAKRKFNFTENFKTMDDARDMIDKFIQINPVKRLGMSNPDSIKEHPWFSSIDWARLEAKEEEWVPWKPELSNETDVRHFSVPEENSVMESVGSRSFERETWFAQF